MTDRFDPIADPRPDDRPWPRLIWPPPAGTVLTGHVIELRPADPERDADELFAALDDAGVWRHVAGRPTDAAELAATLRGRFDLGWHPWIVRLRHDYLGIAAGTLIGTSSYLEVAPNDARLEIGSTTYAERVWGSAVNPDAKLALLRYAFDELGAGRVQLKTDVRNQRSQRAIARLGARYEGTLRRYQRRAEDTVRDTILFSILIEEWPEVRAGLEARLSALTLPSEGGQNTR
jgi:RimJ/RimL family protein N-acetyltransferase